MISMYVSMHACMYVYIRICKLVYVWSVCTYVCMYVYVYVSLCTYDQYVRTYVCMYVYVRVCKLMYIRSVCMNACMYACMHACMYVFTCMHVYIYVMRYHIVDGQICVTLCQRVWLNCCSQPPHAACITHSSGRAHVPNCGLWPPVSCGMPRHRTVSNLPPYTYVTMYVCMHVCMYVRVHGVRVCMFMCFPSCCLCWLALARLCWAEVTNAS
jgi:hypothetical protein